MLRGFTDLLGFSNKLRPLTQSPDTPSHEGPHPKFDHDQTSSHASSPASNSTSPTLPVDEFQDISAEAKRGNSKHGNAWIQASHQPEVDYAQSRTWASNGREDRGFGRGLNLQTKERCSAGQEILLYDTDAGNSPAKNDTMSAPGTKTRKPVDGWKPRDTLNAGPSWLSKAPKQKPVIESNSAQKRSASLSATGQSAVSTSSRAVQGSTSTSEFPVPASKRQKLDSESAAHDGPRTSPGRSSLRDSDGGHSTYMHMDDGLDGRSASFRGVEAMMNSKPKKYPSRDMSQTSSVSQAGSSSSTGSSHSIKGVHTATRPHHADIQMGDDDPTPVKDVASPHFHRPASRNAKGSPDPLHSQEPRARGSSHDPLAGTTGFSRTSKLHLMNGTDDKATRLTVQKDGSKPSSASPAKSPTSNRVKEVVFEDPKIVNIGTPLAVSSASKQVQQNGPDDSSRATDRLSEKFKRDDGLLRRHSIDQTDELQADPPESTDTVHKRRKLNMQKAEALAKQERDKQRSVPGDGFDADDLLDNDTKSLRKSSNRLRKPSATPDGTDKKASEGYSVDSMIDGNNLHKQTGKLWTMRLTRSFEYLSPTGAATIDPNKVTRAEWGGERHVRLMGSKTQDEHYLKHIVFTDTGGLLAFKADMLMFGMIRNLKESQLHYHDDDVRLKKIWYHSLQAFEPADKDTEIGFLERRQAQRNTPPASPVKGSLAPKAKLRDRMQTNHVVSETSSRRNSTNAAPPTGKPQVLPKRDQTVRATRSRGQHESEPAQRLSRKEASSPPKVRFSQRPGALGPKWISPLIFPLAAARSNVARVEWDDLERLDDDEFLNDNIVSFGLRWALEKADGNIKEDVHIFNTYFFASLNTNVNKKTGINYDAVKRWTMKLSKENIFKYKYLVVPINENFHWYAAIICNVDKIKLSSSTNAANPTSSRPQSAQATADNAKKPSDASTPDKSSRTLRTVTGTIERRTSQMTLDDNDLPENPVQIYEDANETPDNENFFTSEDLNKTGKRKKPGPDDPVILILDSFGGTHSDVTRILKNYLREEAKDKCHAELPAEPAGLTGRGIPLQPNFSDCGLYLIAYVSQFLKDPANFVTKSVTRQMKEKEDWPDFNAYTLRDNCRNLILGEGKKQNGLSLNAAEQAAIAEREITRPTSQELPMREGSQQVQLSHEVETHQNKQQEQSQWAEADEEDDSGPHRPPTYDGFTRKHIHDIIDDDSDQPKTVENSRPTTVHTEETEGSGAEGGFIPSIAAYAAKSDAQFQHNDEMLLSDEPATSSPQGPQHVSQFFPGSEGASQTSKDVADILGPSPRLVDAFEQKWQDETLKRVKEQYSKSN